MSRLAHLDRAGLPGLDSSSELRPQRLDLGRVGGSGCFALLLVLAARSRQGVCAGHLRRSDGPVSLLFHSCLLIRCRGARRCEL